MVGHHASPGTITDRPKVGVERVHAGGEAAEVLPVELTSETLYIMEKTLPKALRTQALTALTNDFGLVGLVQYAWKAKFDLVW